MTTDLRGELHRLAEDTTPAAPPRDLWARGTRRKRRLRAVATLVSVGVVVAVAAASVVGLDASRGGAVQPVSGLQDSAIPDRLVTPSRWLPSTAEDGPIGPLAVIAGAEQATSWRGASSNGIIAVSGTTGDYRFLDLAGAAPDNSTVQAPAALSPDGRLVAYWLADPNRPEWVLGIAVYDSTTGEVTRREIPSELGISPDSFSWVSDDRVLASYGVINERRDDGWSSTLDARIWTPAEDRLVDVAGGSVPFRAWPLAGRRFAGQSARGYATWDVVTGERLSNTRLEGAAFGRLSINPRETFAVAIDTESSRRDPRIFMARLQGRQPRLAPVSTDVAASEILGWQDPRHVVLRGKAGNAFGAFAVDVRTGEHTQLVSEERVSWGSPPDYAGRLWRTDTVERPLPPQVLDPRLRAVGGGLAAVALLGGLVMAWRQRARP